MDGNEAEEMKIHTIVTHRSKDTEVLFMGWLAVTHPGLRRILKLAETVVFKEISSGPLRAEDWPGVCADELNAVALEKKGYIFFDCSGGGADFDQHGAAENRGQPFDVVASIDMLCGKTGVLETDPLFVPFVRVISVNDRTGESVTVKQVFDRAGKTPHVARDIRTMVGALNELLPTSPELVRNIFFEAMDGLEYYLGELVLGWEEVVGQELDFDAIDLRAMNFLTVDNAAIGIEHRSIDEDSDDAEDVCQSRAKAKAANFLDRLNDAYDLREREWRTTKKVVDKSLRVKVAVRGLEKPITILVGTSASRTFAPQARRAQADIIIQWWDEGRFSVSRRGDALDLDRVAGYLRLADAEQRGGEIADEAEIWSRDTTSSVLMFDEEIPQFFYTGSGGYCFGNYFFTNPDGLAPTVLTPEEVLQVVIAALRDLPLETALAAASRIEEARARAIAKQ